MSNFDNNLAVPSPKVFENSVVRTEVPDDHNDSVISPEIKQTISNNVINMAKGEETNTVVDLLHLQFIEDLKNFLNERQTEDNDTKEKIESKLDSENESENADLKQSVANVVKEQTDVLKTSNTNQTTIPIDQNLVQNTVENILGVINFGLIVDTTVTQMVSSIKSLIDVNADKFKKMLDEELDKNIGISTSRLNEIANEVNDVETETTTTESKPKTSAEISYQKTTESKPKTSAEISYQKTTDAKTPGVSKEIKSVDKVINTTLSTQEQADLKEKALLSNADLTLSKINKTVKSLVDEQLNVVENYTGVTQTEEAAPQKQKKQKNVKAKSNLNIAYLIGSILPLLFLFRKNSTHASLQNYIDKHSKDKDSSGVENDIKNIVDEGNNEVNSITEEYNKTTNEEKNVQDSEKKVVDVIKKIPGTDKITEDIEKSLNKEFKTIDADNKEDIDNLEQEITENAKTQLDDTTEELQDISNEAKEAAVNDAEANKADEAEEDIEDIEYAEKGEADIENAEIELVIENAINDNKSEIENFVGEKLNNENSSNGVVEKIDSIENKFNKLGESATDLIGQANADLDQFNKSTKESSDVIKEYAEKGEADIENAEADIENAKARQKEMDETGAEIEGPGGGGEDEQKHEEELQEAQQQNVDTINAQHEDVKKNAAPKSELDTAEQAAEEATNNLKETDNSLNENQDQLTEVSETANENLDADFDNANQEISETTQKIDEESKELEDQTELSSVDGEITDGLKNIDDATADLGSATKELAKNAKNIENNISDLQNAKTPEEIQAAEENIRNAAQESIETAKILDLENITDTDTERLIKEFEEASTQIENNVVKIDKVTFNAIYASLEAISTKLAQTVRQQSEKQHNTAMQNNILALMNNK